MNRRHLTPRLRPALLPALAPTLLAPTLLAASLLASAAPMPALAEGKAESAPVAAQPSQRPARFVSAGEVPAGGALVLPLAEEKDVAARAPFLTPAESEAIVRAAKAARFDYKARQTVTLRAIGRWDQVLLLGMKDVAGTAKLRHAGAVAGRALAQDAAAVTIAAQGMDAQALADFATGHAIGEYRSDLFRTRERKPSATTAVTYAGDAASAAQNLYRERGEPLAAAMAWTRDISNEPGNTVYPESFVARATAAFAGVPGVTITVLDVPAMEKLGMGALLSVGRGSARPPRLLAVRYTGKGAPKGAPLVLAGKGITFDSGGISIKPGAGMGAMRMDMSGAASVTGAVLSLARSGAPVDVVAVAALAENMPDGNATRPGDVARAINGMTIEIDNTDAEGRLVLADAVAWAERTYAPSAIVDVATLTGAIRTALGDDYAGLFSRNEPLAAQLLAASDASGEGLWRMPLHESYATDTESTYADIRNTGAEGAPGAGAGAHFIGAFITPRTPWAHLDIAGVAWGNAVDWKPAGSSAFAVRLLDHFARNWKPAPEGEAKP